MSQPTGPSLADLKWGFEFGIEGVMTTKDVCGFLSTNRTTLSRLVDEGRLRKGKRGENIKSRSVYCRRSVREYVRSLEE